MNKRAPIYQKPTKQSRKDYQVYPNSGAGEKMSNRASCPSFSRALYIKRPVPLATLSLSYSTCKMDKIVGNDENDYSIKTRILGSTLPYNVSLVLRDYDTDKLANSCTLCKAASKCNLC